MMPLLIASELSKSFGPTVALDAVSFDLAACEVHALVGENGAGKSTLVKVLSGACRPDTGHMTLGDERYHPKEPREAQSRGVAMVYQELSPAPHLSVRDNVLLGIESATGLGVLRREDNERRTREALAAIDHQDIASGARVADLSPARRQLVEIARALAQPSCRVLILDEPTSSLSADDVDRLFQLIRRLASRELGIIYISHFLEEVTRIADRITVLRDGRSVGIPPGSQWMLFPPGVWLALLLALLVAGLLGYTRAGKHIFAVGSNESMARLSGVRVERVKLLVYVMCSTLAGLAGVMQFSRLTVGDPTVAIGFELDVIAAVVIGGGSLSGGEGSVAGSLVGALLMTLIRSGCTHLGISNWVQEILTGLIIVGAVAIDSLRRRA